MSLDQTDSPTHGHPSHAAINGGELLGEGQSLVRKADPNAATHITHVDLGDPYTKDKPAKVSSTPSGSNLDSPQNLVHDSPYSSITVSTTLREHQPPETQARLHLSLDSHDYVNLAVDAGLLNVGPAPGNLDLAFGHRETFGNFTGDLEIGMMQSDRLHDYSPKSYSPDHPFNSDATRLSAETDGRLKIAPGLNLTGSFLYTSRATDNPAELYIGSSLQKQEGRFTLIGGIQEKVQVSSAIRGADTYGQTGASYSTSTGTTFSFFYNHDFNHDLRYQKPDDNLTFSVTQRF